MQIFSKTLNLTAKIFVLLLAVACFLLAYTLANRHERVAQIDSVTVRNQ